MDGFRAPIWTEGANRHFTAQPPLPGATVDLLVVGGGFLGLSAALHASRLGLGVQVLEAGTIGEHASGLNGGQVIPGLKYDPEWLIRAFGDRRGEAIVDFAARTADAVFDLIEREKLDVPHRRSGWIQACHTEKALVAARSRFRQWKARGADVSMLDAGEIRSLIGTKNYLGGFLDRRAGTINPLALALEMARLAGQSGARIAENTRCTGISPMQGGFAVQTERGVEIRATRVLVATNAYADGLVPGLSQSVIPLHSLQIATHVLDPAEAAAILPGGQAVSDSRRILVYYRKTETGRLLLGGRGPMRLPDGPGDWTHLERALVRLFPSMREKRLEKRWFGRVGVTPDHLPHIHEPAPGLIAMLGCQGRGVGLMTAAAPLLVDYLARRDPELLPLPLTSIRPIPFHRFRRAGVAGMIAWYRMLDALER